MGDSDCNPSLKLSFVLLNANNYVLWSRVVNLSLGSKKKLDFINGKIVPPAPASTSKAPATDSAVPPVTDPDSAYDNSLSNDQLVRSWLLNSMEPHIAGIFTFSDSTKELWDSVTVMYGSRNNIARAFQIENEIATALQGERKFCDLIGHMKRLWDELHLYRPHTTHAHSFALR